MIGVVLNKACYFVLFPNFCLFNYIQAVGLSFSGVKKDNISADVELEIPFDYSELPKPSGTTGVIKNI